MNNIMKLALMGGGGINYRNLGLVSEAFLANNVEALPNIYYKLSGVENTIVGYNQLSDNKLIAWPIVVDGTGFLRMDKVALGSNGFSLKNRKNYESVTGTWITANPPNYYASSIGATQTITITGVNKITYYSYSDNRGGLWNFSINGGPNIPISVYNSTLISREQTIADNLDEKETYTIVGTFAGQDPANPVATPRGWAFFGNEVTTGGFYLYANTFISQQLLTESSNSEMAYNIAVTGESYGAQWVPFHNSEATMIPISRIIKVDGVAVSDFSTSRIKNCQKIEITGEYNCINTNEPAQVIGKMTTYYKIDKYGFYVDHKYQAYVQQNVTGYGWMLPVHRGFATLLTDNLANTYDLTKINQPADAIANADNVRSFKVTSNIAGLETYQLTSAFVDAKALRIGEIDRGYGSTSPYPVLVVENRNNATLNKVYCASFKSHIMESGEVFACKNIYYAGKTL